MRAKRSILRFKIEDVKCNWNFQPLKHMHKKFQKRKTHQNLHAWNEKNIFKKMQTPWTTKIEV